eukprot:10555692-Alexandrium_andersonii.AAC.1
MLSQRDARRPLQVAPSAKARNERYTPSGPRQSMRAHSHPSRVWCTRQDTPSALPTDIDVEAKPDDGSPA